MDEELKLLLTPTTDSYKIYPPKPVGLKIFTEEEFNYIARFYDDYFHDLLFTINRYKNPHELSYKKYRLREYIFYYEKKFEMADKKIQHLFYGYHEKLMLQIYAEFDSIVLPEKIKIKFKIENLKEAFKSIISYKNVIEKLYEKGIIKNNTSGNPIWNTDEYGSGKVLADFYYYLKEKDLLVLSKKDNSDLFAKLIDKEFGFKRTGRNIREYKKLFNPRSNTFTFLSL